MNETEQQQSSPAPETPPVPPIVVPIPPKPEPQVTTMPKPAKPRSNKRMIVLLVVLVVVLGGGYFWWQVDFTVDISRFFAAEEAMPKYEWTLIDSNTYPDLTAKNNNCSAWGGITQDQWTCNRMHEGMVVRMYGVQQVGDRIGQGWNESLSADKRSITYRRWEDCQKAGTTNAGPGHRVYECKNVGDPEPSPSPPPDYRWVKVGGAPAFNPDMKGQYASVDLKAYGPCQQNITTVVTCDASTVGKGAVAEYKATAYIVAADRGTYFQAHAGTLQADPSKLSLTGFDETTCSGSPSYRRLGAGYRSWEAWQCQAAAVEVTPPAPTVDLKCHAGNAVSDGPCTIPSGTSATFSWASTDATSCSGSSTPLTADGNPITYPTLPTQGTAQRGPIEQQAIFTLICTGPGGTASDTVTINVLTDEIPLTCSPKSQQVSSGEMVSLNASGATGEYSWHVTDGDPSGGTGATFQTSFTHFGPPTTKEFVITVAEGLTECAPLPECARPGADPQCSVAQVAPDGLPWCSGETDSCTVSVGCALPACAAPPDGCYYEEVNVCSCGTLVCDTITPTPTPTESPTITPTPTPTSEEMMCAPSSQTVSVNQAAEIQVSGGSGVYSWSAPGGVAQTSSDADTYRVSYSSPGGYTVTVNDGQGEFAQCVVTVSSDAETPTPTPIPTATVPPGNVALGIEKTVRNVSRGTAESDNTPASAGETVEFVIRVTSFGNETARNVSVSDALPVGLTYVLGSLTVNGVSRGFPTINGSPPLPGPVTLIAQFGDMLPGQQSIVRVRATVDSGIAAESTTDITNLAIADASNMITTVSDGAIVILVGPDASVIPPAAEVETGPGQATVLALVISAIVTLLYVGYSSTDAFRRREAVSYAQKQHPDFRP